ncbi:M-phase inducer phosphatase 3 isoform X1 [Pipistrellus kuhlii]|uniref:M-phase inducer phosphatase n=1 Tax=Pipistrellus kuhlii TaxID=59472 RepID=A0A7J7X9E0_PIPKU|nr:M-phase inducer phosphatase 3 isoform X1 [Pipistrellus kuhlii]XP_045432499.1 M-phase inducer phosphatase 3 isoform X1 [Pipistrellus kuhlii]XP_045432500.1 M-phase inducer phosphatase 3 isoform X1 [Pipistrellus kuhlii]KAF6346274.1 cell division cycle 25C [Pipistrellus kuhlii]
MSAELTSSTREEGSPGRGPSFRSHQRKILNLLLERDTSFTIYPDLPGTPVDKLFGDSGNQSVLSGGTPKRCLDLSNLSSGEMSATQLTASADLDGTGREKEGPLDSSGPQEIQLAWRNHHKHLIKCSPGQPLCSTPKALDHGNQKTDAICSSSTNKENENKALKPLECGSPKNLKFQKKSGGPYMSPLSSLDNGNLVESEMKYLGSPIAIVPKLGKNLKLGKDQAEEISDELMEFSLEDQEESKGLGLRKTVSLCDINATQMLEAASNQGYLTGDFSKVCALPTVSGRHQDLKYISPETVAALLLGKFQGLIEKFYIIDCRYPYEYLGGHIQGALNLFSQEELCNFFLKMPVVPLDAQKRIIIVFHCEFSSERGPRMCRSLREEDRALNQYPALYYPELYILKGGYRDFFPDYPVLCEPQSYCPMHHQDHKAELLRCRSQSKAWEGKRQLQEQIALLVKAGNLR